MLATTTQPVDTRVPRVVPVPALSIVALGPALGGLAIGAGWGLTSPMFIGVVLLAGSIALAVASVTVDRCDRPVGSAGA